MSHIFLSYSRKDTDFMIRLRGHLRANAFEVWTDDRLEPGTPDWVRAIEQAIRESRCMVVILSPDAKESLWVGREISMAEERGLRIFPIFWRGEDDTAVPFRLINHQRVDARQNADQALGQIAAAIQRYLNGSAAQETSHAADLTRVVARLGPADYRTISEAIREAPEGARILVRPGLYRETLILDRSLEIVGDGPLAEIVIESTEAECIFMATDYAVVRGLTLRLRAGARDGTYYAVYIPRGRLVLESCDITSGSSACIGIHGSTADPVIRDCEIHDGNQYGVLVWENGQGLIEDCDIFATAYPGVSIQTGGNPTLRGCQIHDSKQSGIYVWENGQGLIEDCDIFANGLGGVIIRTGGDPAIRRCRITRNAWYGVFVHDNGAGTVEDCTLTGNNRGAWNVKDDCPVTRRNNIE